jgi:hypothetical protein
MPSGMHAGLAQRSTQFEWIDDPRPHAPAVAPERMADVYCVRRWCETPAEAPARMEARAFEPIAPREVLRAVLRRARVPAAPIFVRSVFARSVFIKATGAGSRA